MKSVGRLATYLQGYGDLLVATNGWDPAVLERFRADPVVAGFLGGIDSHATTGAARAHRHPAARRVAGGQRHRHGRRECAATVRGQLALGCDGVILHGATPTELAPVVAAYRAARPDRTAAGVRRPRSRSRGRAR